MTARNSVLAIGTVTFGLIATAIIANAETKDGATPAANPLKERLVEQFRALDKNRDDRLTKAELGDGLFEHCPKPKPSFRNAGGRRFSRHPVIQRRRDWNRARKSPSKRPLSDKAPVAWCRAITPLGVWFRISA
jgi:hypothetical protein